jgi:hypothetical protein
MTEFERVPQGGFGLFGLVGVLVWLVRLPFRVKAYCRNAGLWPDPNR